MTKYHTFTFFAVEEHTYLLWDETGEACVVDAGMFRDEEKELFRSFIDGHNLKLVRAIHTHLHFDHMIGAKWIQDTYGITPEASRIDIDEKVPLSQGLIDRSGVLASLIHESDFEALPEEDRLVTFGNSTLRALSVPGHTPGHVAFYDEESGIVLSGDVLFRGDIGRTDLWKGDYRQLLESIHSRLFTLPEDTKVLPGHGPETTIGEEKRSFRYH